MPEAGWQGPLGLSSAIEQQDKFTLLKNFLKIGSYFGFALISESLDL